MGKKKALDEKVQPLSDLEALQEKVLSELEQLSDDPKVRQRAEELHRKHSTLNASDLQKQFNI